MAFDSTKAFACLSRLENRKRLFYSHYQDVTDYVIPRKGNLYGWVNEGQKRTQKLYESTAIHSNELLSASLQGSLTSPVVQWFSLSLSDGTLNQDRYVSLWLDMVAKLVYRVLSHSNFNSEIFEVYLDLGAFGTGCLFVEEQPGPEFFNGLYFDSLDIGEYVIDENKEGYVDTNYWTRRMSARIAESFFGPKDFAKCGEKIKVAAKEKPEEMFEFLHVVAPRGYSSRAGSRGYPFASCWYEKESTTLIRESGYEEFPFMVPRWLKTSGELWGRSPAMTAMPDIKSLNKIRQLVFRALGKAIDPPMKILDDGVIGNVKLGSGQATVVRDMESLEAIQFQGRPDFSTLEEKKLQDAIRRIFFTDQLQLQQGGPQMTATEVQIRFELMQRLLGPTFGRLMSELLQPLIRRVIGILWRRGMLPPLPPILEKRGFANIEIEYEGPLARAQRSQDVLAIDRWFQVNQPLIAIDPQVTDVLETDQIAADSGKVLGMRPSWLASDDKIKERRDARAQQQQQERAAQAAQTVGDVASKTAPMVKTMAENPDAGQRLQQFLNTGV